MSTPVSLKNTAWVTLWNDPDHDQSQHSKKPVLHQLQSCLPLSKGYKHLENNDYVETIRDSSIVEHFNSKNVKSEWLTLSIDSIQSTKETFYYIVIITKVSWFLKIHLPLIEMLDTLITLAEFNSLIPWTNTSSPIDSLSAYL